MKTKLAQLVVLCLAFYGAGLALADECRGLWVNAFAPGYFNAEQVKQLVSDCRQYNFNAVFVEMRARGDAFYMPKAPILEPRAAALAQDFDALAEIIRQCHEGKPRIAVHCWLVSHLIWSHPEPPVQASHIYNRHRDWLTSDADGETRVDSWYYLDPGHPDANQWLHDIALDVVSRYDVDGLHWDYLRYAGRDAGYNRTAIQRYNREFGSKGQPSMNDARFCDWRRRQLTDFVRWTTADMLQIKPQLVVSAAVFANYSDAKWYRFADWVNWLQEGIMDVAIPMNFTPDSGSRFFPRAAFARTNAGVRAVYMGQGAYMNTAENTLKQLKRCREMGIGGAVLYSYDTLVANRIASPTNTVDESRESVLVDDLKAETKGEWQQSHYGKCVGNGYCFSLGGTGAKYVQFAPKLPGAGAYDVYEWHVAGENRATDAPFQVIHSGGTNVVKVNQQSGGARWNYLGRFTFAADSPGCVRVTDAIQSAEQVVIADAIRFVRVPAGSTERSPGNPGDFAAQQQEAGHEREAFLKVLKEQFQPQWSEAPRLPWKANPKTGIIKGRVTDSAEGKAMYNAVVSIVDQPARSQKTEPHGAYAFFEVPPGIHTITAKAGGFGTVTKKVEVQVGIVVQADMSLGR